MARIALTGAPDSVEVEDGIARYQGSYGDQPIIVTVTLDEIVQAYPQLAGEPLDAAARLTGQVESIANRVVEAGREPAEAPAPGNLHLELARADLTSDPRPVGAR
jgi:hypothetical protein